MSDRLRATFTIDVDRATPEVRFERLVEEIQADGGQLEPDDTFEHFVRLRCLEAASRLAESLEDWKPVVTLNVDGEEVELR